VVSSAISWRAGPDPLPAQLVGVDIACGMGHPEPHNKERIMLLQFFGFKDNPFKLAPDPAYLFLGRYYEEALAHLRYAVTEGEGFTAITGARGIGKTTICRAFLDTLGDGTAAAFISSPVSSPGDLLRRINTALGIPCAAATLKGLIDPLNDFLMRQKLAGKKVVVFIDDAQGLGLEVLEQIRLISNLETTREKLIQIVLVGEPGLMTQLNSHELRQMGQRVSVRYEIGPLSPDETAAYIQHRVSVASTGSPVEFEPAALRHVFHYSRGNPRLIHAACQAALTAAFAAREKTVTAASAQAAVMGLAAADGKDPNRRRRRRALGWAVAGGGVIVLAAAAFFALPGLEGRPASEKAIPEQADLAAPAETAARPPVSVSAEAVVASTGADPGTDSSAPPPAPGEKAVSAAKGSAPRMTHSVQVGAYLVPENARKQVEQLGAKGYPAQIFEAKDSRGRTWYAVRIGDYPSSAAARRQADEFTRRELAPSVVRPAGGF
jgi:type II secretory pathway predicted ATPase ExeA/cell division protein FtsN